MTPNPGGGYIGFAVINPSNEFLARGPMTGKGIDGDAGKKLRKDRKTEAYITFVMERAARSNR